MFEILEDEETQIAPVRPATPAHNHHWIQFRTGPAWCIHCGKVLGAPTTTSGARHEP